MQCTKEFGKDNLVPNWGRVTLRSVSDLLRMLHGCFWVARGPSVGRASISMSLLNLSCLRIRNGSTGTIVVR
jgi:hypothetical protein